MGKLERFGVELEEYVNVNTGECLNLKEVIKVTEYCKKDDLIKSKMKGLKRLRTVKGLMKFKHNGDKFGMLYFKSFPQLPYEVLGFYHRLTQDVLEDGSYRVVRDCHDTIKEVAVYYEMSTYKLKSYLSHLKDVDLIDFDKLNVWINPKYLKVGLYVKREVIERFNIPLEEVYYNEEI